MLVSGRPLRATTYDIEAHFVGRDEQLDELSRATRDFGLNALIVGPRGYGATSLLRALQVRLEGDERGDVYFVDGAGLSPELLVQVLREVVGPRTGRGSPFHAIDNVLGPKVTEWSQTGRLLDDLGAVRETLLDEERVSNGEGTALILLDLPSMEAVRTLFGGLRDQTWAVPAHWVVTVDAADESAARRPPADAFFESVVHLGPLEPGDARELLERRLDAGARERLLQEGPRVLDVIVEIAEGVPRRLVELLKIAVVDGVDALDQHLDLLTVQRARMVSISQPARDLVEALRVHGPSSASDEDLQRRLGWSRSRIAQVLAELREADLVHAQRGESSADGGRRRLLYAVRGADDDS